MDSPLGSYPGDPARAGRLELTSIGTATTLLRCGGFTIPTDPDFLHAGERAYLGLGRSSRRVTDPAMGIDDRPLLDAVVLSHHHGDHFDRVAATAGGDPAALPGHRRLPDPPRRHPCGRRPAHLEGAQGVEALRIVSPARAVPIHYDYYTAFKCRSRTSVGRPSRRTWRPRSSTLPGASRSC
jgi:L-ascorbate metabolism protein UlaG (beta-lactamase superfamily)